MTDVEQVKPGVSVAGLDDDELLLIRAELASYWIELDEKGRAVEGWDKPSLIETHAEVVDEIEARGLPNQELGGLDDVAVKQVELEPVSTTRQKILAALDDGFKTKADLRREIDAPEQMVREKFDDLLQAGEIEYVAMDRYKLATEPDTPDPEDSAPITAKMADVLDLGAWQ